MLAFIAFSLGYTPLCFIYARNLYLCASTESSFETILYRFKKIRCALIKTFLDMPKGIYGYHRDDESLEKA